MGSFNRDHLQNIRDIFENKTGVELSSHKSVRHPVRTGVVLVAVVACFFTITAYAISLFSSLSGDDLGLTATYEGNGVVSIQVENRSDKDLNFQSRLKLMRWSTNEEVMPISNKVTFSGTEFAAHSSGVMTIDISNAYDMEFLEQPLVDDHYYFVLTNNNFIFGQDWMCTVSFSDPIETITDEPDPVAPAEADKELAAQVMEELQPYFANYTADPDDRNNMVKEYYAKCKELLSKINGNVVAPVSPMLLVDCMNPTVVFDDTAPLETQHWLTGEHYYTLDGYNMPVGATETDRALVLSAYVPLYKGEIDGGAEVPLIYIFTYDVNDIKSSQDYAFIRGQLVTFEQMEQYKVYEDSKYVCYEVTDLFYSDLRQHTESIISQRTDVYFDEQVWQRVQNIYNFFKEKDTLNSRFSYENGVD